MKRKSSIRLPGISLGDEEPLGSRQGSGVAADGTANSTKLDDVTMALEQLAPLEEAPWLADVDPKALKKDRSFRIDQRMQQLRVFFKDVFKLLLNVVSLMSVARAFAAEVSTSSSRVSLVGRQNFDIMVGVLSYFPLLYILLVVPRFFTLRSHLLWNEFLMRGVIIDFPPSNTPPFLFTHSRPMVFILGTTFYFGYSVFVFSLFGAANSVLLLFFKLVFIDIGLSWYTWQTVEKSLISLSRFIEAFDDRSSAGGANIDKYTCTRAAKFLPRLRPAQAKCSYLSYTHRYGINRRSDVLYKWTVRLAGMGLAVGLGVGAVFYFDRVSSNAERKVWQTAVGQCSRVCFDAVDRDPSKCFWCACNCVTATGVQWDAEKCLEELVVPGCNATTMCSRATCAE